MAEDKELDPTESDPVAGDPADVDSTDETTQDEPGEDLTGADVAGDDKTSQDDSAAGDDEPGDDEPGDDEEPGDADAELVPAGASSKKSPRAAKGSAVATSEGKGRPTRKQATAPAAPARTGPVTFVKESAAELRKVVYPTGEQLRTFFIVVLVFVLFIIAFSSLLDLGFGWLVLRIFG